MNLDGKRVWVYRNLKFGRGVPPLYSVMWKWKVIARVNEILLHDCKFVVRQGGYKRVLKTGRKNVHAFVVGTVLNTICGIDKYSPDYDIKINYNPKIGDRFYAYKYNLLGKEYLGPVKGACNVLLNGNGMSGELIEEL